MCRVDTDMKSVHLLSSAQFMLNCVADVQNISKIVQYSAHIIYYFTKKKKKKKKKEREGEREKREEKRVGSEINPPFCDKCRHVGSDKKYF